jgi:hypothetical protein
MWAKLKDWKSWLTVTTCDGEPWTSGTSARRRMTLTDLCQASRPWREWLVVLHADGRPWGTPGPSGIVPGRWMQKIAAELATLSDITTEEVGVFVECNHSLIEERFAVGVRRTDVVQELHELMETTRMILAAE